MTIFRTRRTTGSLKKRPFYRNFKLLRQDAQTGYDGRNGELMRTGSKVHKLLLVACVTSLSFANAALAHESEDEDTPVTPTRSAENPNIKNLKYVYTINENSYPLFPEVVKAMQPDLKNTSGDLRLPYPANPSLNIAQFDLNGDGIEEIIAVPIENTEDGNYCKGDFHKCPHYIIDISGKNPKVVGVIRAFAIDRGDEIKNGYWTLKAFKDSRLPANDPQIDIYSYDTKQKTYASAPTPQ